MVQPVPAPVADREWVAFPGGELEGTRPRALCPACRARLKAQAGGAGRANRPQGRPPLCFHCYRAELDRERALRAAGRLETASEERFQSALPLEPVNAARLQGLRAERSAARAALSTGDRFADRRRRAQIAARHALRHAANEAAASSDPRRRDALAAAAHAAELQLPESWLPFVMSG